MTRGDGRGEAGLRLTKDYQQDVFAEDDYSSVKGPDGVKEPVLQPPEAGVGRPYMVSEAVGTLSRACHLLPPHRCPQAVQQGQGDRRTGRVARQDPPASDP